MSRRKCIIIDIVLRMIMIVLFVTVWIVLETVMKKQVMHNDLWIIMFYHAFHMWYENFGFINGHKTKM